MGNSFAIIAGLVAMFGWGFEDFFVKQVVDKAGSAVTLFWTQIISLIIIACLFLFTGNNIIIVDITLLIQLFFLGILDYIAFAFFWKALEKVDVSISGPIVSSYSVFATIVSFLVFAEPLSLEFFVLVGIIALGLVLAIYKKQPASSNNRKGVIESLLSMLSFSLLFPLLDNAVQGSVNWIFALLVVRIGFAISSIIRLINTKTNPFYIHISWIKDYTIIATCNITAYVFLVWGFNTSHETSLITAISSAYTIPTLILARYFLNEKLTKQQLIGIIIVIVGLIALPFFGFQS
jgi:drug/metabolite transporter (DMT)-like permease